MTETYTFSRALHMMRYGRKKMRPTKCKTNAYVYIHKSDLGDVLRVVENGYDTTALSIDSSSILGSWEEVKDESN